MRDMLAQIRTASGAGLYYVGLFAALALPDICGALEAEDGLSTQARYVAWFDQHVAPKYTFSGRTTLTGQDAYFFRCSMLHQGRMQHPRGTYSRILFVEPSSTGNVFHNNVLNDALNIDVRIFTEDIVSAVEQWLPTAGTAPRFRQNYAAFATRYPQGSRHTSSGYPSLRKWPSNPRLQRARAAALAAEPPTVRRRAA